ncbi:Tyrosine-protein kinase [Parasponia andersonii]|uniref:Tyrosine-protein kinase n=1 Tax=Parasponia andersonii TaxID=3476 RepID=A0A2P5AAE1_PARAD|nr:Tyrosine-protein kinase [Parasponia andersonii]
MGLFWKVHVAFGMPIVRCFEFYLMKLLCMHSSVQGHKEWINEVNFLGVVKHPNLVKLVGYCAEDDERGIQRLLVYELMRNKSLEDHLLARMPSPLMWITRLKIAQDAARGLAYLHEEMDFQLIFRDFKTSNILLDEDFNAKLSDFGLARQGPPEGISHVSTAVVGTVGYAAPEYVQTGKLTAKSDVWSFGVVLYELITGRRAVERNLPRSEQKLLEWVKPYVSDSKKFHIIVDPRLEGDYCIKSAQKLASLANRCLLKQPKSRPKMSEVVEILGNIISETASQEVAAPQPVSETEEPEEETTVESEPVSTKQGNNYLKKVFDIREMVNLRNKSIGKLDWRNWTPGLVRTS